MHRILFYLLFSLSLTISAAEFTGRHASVPGGTLQIMQIHIPEQVGDIYLLKTPEEKYYLIDTGLFRAGESVLIPYLKKHGISRIETVIITHFHTDHAGGMFALLNDSAFEIGSVIYTGTPENFYSGSYTLRLQNSILQLLKRNNVPAKEVKKGDIIEFGSGIKGHVVGAANRKKKLAVNNNSLVFRLVYGDFSVLFTGDCEFRQDSVILAEKPYLKSDILKAGHHGGAGSTSIALLDAVSPKMVISPMPEWLSNSTHLSGRLFRLLQKRGIPFYRSWEFPGLIIFSDGKTFGLSGFSQ